MRGAALGAWAVIALAAPPAAAQATPDSPPAAAPAPTGPAPTAPASAAPAPARRIDLMEFRVEGNTILPQRDIEAALYPFLGPDRAVDDVEKARAALEELYGKRGYPTVSASIPPQSGAGGVVVLQVAERPIGRLRVVGARYVAPSAIKAGVPSLTEGKVPRMAELQAELAAANQLPDRTITPALRAGRAPDTIDVDLKVEDHLPLHGSLELNNRRSQQTTALRTSGSLSYDNLWQRGDSASIGFQVAPQRLNDSKVGTVGYVFRIPDSRMSLSASYVQTDSNVSTGASGNVIGKGKTFGLRLLMPLEGAEGFTHSLSVGADYKDLTQDVGLGGQFTSSPISYVPFSASYLASWSGARSTTDLSTALVMGFNGIGSGQQDYDNKRLRARADFAYVKADFDHTHTLPYNIEVYARAQALMSPTPLVSSEQLSVGGLDTVRGYLESETLGDYGGAGQFELRSPPLARFVGGPLTKLQFLTFVDAGATKVRLPGAGENDSQTVASAGVGASLRLFDHIGGEIDNATVLIKGPTSKKGANRVLFRLYGDF